MTEHQKNSRFDLPRPQRTISGERLVARPSADAPAPEITVGFSDEEPPTADMPKPILTLLLRATVPTEQEATPEPVATELPSAPQRTAKPARRRRRPALPLFAGVLVGALGGASVWHWGFANDEPKAALASGPSATTPAPHSAPRVETQKSEVPSAAPQAAAPLPKLDTASLLAQDGSESAAPTCEELLVGGSPDRKHPGSDHFRAARAALIRGDLDASQRAFCKATGATNAPATVSLELAQLLLLRRDAAAASLWLEQAASLAPESTRILELKGDAAVRVGNLDEARSAWLRAEGLRADDGAGIDRMVQRALAGADASLRARDPRRAERLLRKVLAFRPNDAAVHAKLGITLTRLGFPNSAELWFRRSAELDG